jgi:hypothetical protein
VVVLLTPLIGSLKQRLLKAGRRFDRSLPSRTSFTMAKAQALSVHVLSKSWTFKQADDTGDDGWMSVKKVPTNVHLDLMDHDKYVLIFQGSQTFDRN